MPRHLNRWGGAGIEGERSGLWSEMARIIGEIQPKFAFMENSPMLTLRGLGRVLGDLSEMGYDADWGIVGAHHVSAPHKRERIWILAHSNLPKHFSNRNAEGEEGRISKEHRQKRCSRRIGGTSGYSEILAYPVREGLEGIKYTRGTDEARRQITNGSVTECSCLWWRSDPADWSTESRLGRVANGVADRSKRLKAIGNGQVPLVAATAFQILGGKLK